MNAAYVALARKRSAALNEVDARRMVEAGIALEERRTRKADPRQIGEGRRLSDVLAGVEGGPFVVAHERSFRVISGLCAGEIVGADDVCECERCDGSGRLETERDSFGLRELADCSDCGGVGVVLGYPTFGPPTRVEPLEAPSAGYSR